MLARRLAAAGLGALALTAATATAATPPDLVLKQVATPPASLKAGASFNLKVRIENEGKASRGGKLTITLQGGPAGYNVPKRIGRFTVDKLDAGKFRKYRFGLTVPFRSKTGRYTLKTCLKTQGRQQCQTSPKFRVTKTS